MAALVETYTPTGKEVPFANGRYLLSHRLGNGSFGDIFEGWDTVGKKRVAVKLEKKKVRFPQLDYESKVYRILLQANSEAGPRRGALPSYVIGVPQVYYFDSEGDYNIMVMELCGPSLEDLFNYCHRRLSLKTVLMIADQLIRRLEHMHDRGFVHRDIKPENFVFGTRLKSHVLHIIDFGLSKMFFDLKKNAHIPFAEGKPLTGTARYCSANTHRGYEQSRRDDLESVGFLLVYFLKGSLPWQGIQAKDQQQKTIKIGQKKIATPLEELCKGLPTEFLTYAQYCRNLTFQQRPDYTHLCQLFRDLAARMDLSLPPQAATPASASHRFSELSLNPLVPSGSPVTSGEDPLRGFYDWDFDWVRKRRREVLAGQSGGHTPPKPEESPSTNAQHGSISCENKGAL